MRLAKARLPLVPIIVKEGGLPQEVLILNQAGELRLSPRDLSKALLSVAEDHEYCLLRWYTGKKIIEQSEEVAQWVSVLRNTVLFGQHEYVRDDVEATTTQTANRHKTKVREASMECMAEDAAVVTKRTARRDITPSELSSHLTALRLDVPDGQKRRAKRRHSETVQGEDTLIAMGKGQKRTKKSTEI